MRKKLLFFTSLLAFVTQTANAQLLWKITNDKAGKVSYLFGSHHVAPLSVCDNVAGFWDAFASCEQFYGEIVMDDMAQASKDMIAYLMMPKDTTWQTLFTEQEYQKLDDFLKEYMKVGVQQLQMVKPLVISTQLLMMLMTDIFKDFDHNEQIDMTLQKRAKEQGMSIKGFETVAYQSTLMFCVPLAEQAADLMEMVNDFEKSKRQSVEMCDLYMKHDLDNLLKLMEMSESGMVDAKMDRLVYARNRNWVEQLMSDLPERSAFIVVGAGHLPGEQGLIELLRKQGYKVTPVK